MNAEYIFKAKDTNGNDVDCIGLIFSLDLNRKLFDIQEVKKEFESRGIDTKKYFKDNKKSTAFTDAISAMSKYFKKQGCILHKVTDDNSSTVYALDRKIVNKAEKEMFTSDNTAEVTVVVDEANYENVANFIYDKGNDRVITDSQERMADLVRVLNVYINSYTKNKFSGKVNDIIEKLGGCINWRRRGGVYFVPAKHRTELYKVIEAVNTLDRNAIVKIGEVANLSEGRHAVAVSVDEEIGGRIDLIREKIAELYKKGDLDRKDLVNATVALGEELKILQQYQVICDSSLSKTTGTIEEVQEILREALLTGKITKPIVKEKAKDEEWENLLSEM